MFTAAHIHIFFAKRRTSGRSAVEAVTTKRLLDDKKMFPTLATGMGFRFRPSCISQRAMKGLGCVSVCVPLTWRCPHDSSSRFPNPQRSRVFSLPKPTAARPAKAEYHCLADRCPIVVWVHWFARAG